MKSNLKPSKSAMSGHKNDRLTKNASQAVPQRPAITITVD